MFRKHERCLSRIFSSTPRATGGRFVFTIRSTIIAQERSTDEKIKTNTLPWPSEIGGSDLSPEICTTTSRNMYTLTVAVKTGRRQCIVAVGSSRDLRHFSDRTRDRNQPFFIKPLPNVLKTMFVKHNSCTIRSHHSHHDVYYLFDFYFLSLSHTYTHTIVWLVCRDIVININAYTHTAHDHPSFAFFYRFHRSDKIINKSNLNL